MKSLVLLLFILPSCTHKNQKNEEEYSYPEIITKHHLEKKFDFAKWEIYKNNYLNYHKQDKYFLNFQNDSLMSLVLQTRKKFYEIKSNEEPLPTQLLIDILGNKNVKKLIEMDLEFFPEDSVHIFKKDEIHITFFPVMKENEYWQSLQGMCYSIIFRNDSIVRLGCKDYYEIGYSAKKSDDIKFAKYLQQKKGVNNWLKKYIENKKTAYNRVHSSAPRD